MKPVQLYEELQNLAEKVGLHVTEQNFRTTGIHVRSGFCKVKEEDWCIIDKHIKLAQKIDVLAECLSAMPLDSVFILPAVRKFLESFKPAEKQEKNIESEYQETESTETDETDATSETEDQKAETPDVERSD